MAYHHGNLRATILAAAATSIAADGPAALSLRSLARQAEVSHTAPRHHFGDKRGVLTALAAQGHRELAEQLRTAENFLEAGVAYVAFAHQWPAHFAVMFHPELVDVDDPELAEASDRSNSMLRAAASTRTGAPMPVPDSLARAAWSIAHGFATLAASGNFGSHRDVGELADQARETLRHLDAGGGGR